MSEEFKTFLCSYNCDGAQWVFQIKALDQNDADRRLGFIKSWGRVDGELMMTVPGEVGFVVPWIVGIRNWLVGLFR